MQQGRGLTQFHILKPPPLASHNTPGILDNPMGMLNL
jgi:hypothetical protein